MSNELDNQINESIYNDKILNFLKKIGKNINVILLIIMQI